MAASAASDAARPDAANGAPQAAAPSLRALLPHGAGLPDDVWPRRHRALLAVVWAHAILLTAFALHRGLGWTTAVGEGLLIALLGAVAAWPSMTRRANAAATALALAVSSLVLLHASGGRTEAHAHAFIVLALVALYQEWAPFLLAIAYLAFGLLVATAIDPAWVHSSPDALAHPWTWSLVHVVALLAEGVALAALWTGSEHLRSRSAVVLDAADEAVLGLAGHGAITFANPAAGRLLGTRPEALIGRDARHVLRGLPITLAAGTRMQAGDLETASRRVAVEWSVAPKLRDGQAIGWVLVVRDVSERRELERQLEARSRQQAAVATLGQEALLASSLDDLLGQVAHEVARVLSVTHCKVLELAPDRRTFLLRAGVGWRPGLVGTLRIPADLHSQSGYTLRHDGPVVVEDLRQETRFRGAALLQEHAVVSGMTVLLKTREGPFGVLGVHTTAPRRFSEDDIHFLQAVANLTANAVERHGVDAQLRAHRDNLEALVERRTAALTEANRELEAFSYTVSHDLRSPLRAIDGFSRLLLRRHGDELPDESRQMLTSLSDGALRMGNLIESVLALTRIGRADLRDEPLDLSGAAQEVLAGLRARDPSRRVTWSIEPGLVAHGDPELVRLALHNLLANAWKFTAKTDPARITFRRLHGPDGPAFAIEDNGAGFDMAHAKELFQPFHRLHEPSQFEGTGIGLASVARVVRRHGGRIWAHAEVGRGATFFFTLPGLAPAEPRLRPRPTPGTQESALLA